MTELIRALRCSNSTDYIDCIKEKCKYFYREPQEVIDKFREEHGGKFREFPDDIFETCDCEQIALDAADELEKLCESEGKYRWHDLRKNPDDLPAQNGDYMCRVKAGKYPERPMTYVPFDLRPEDSNKWRDFTHYVLNNFVIAWREIDEYGSEDANGR